MDNKLIICNIGFMVTTAVAIHHVSSWAQNTGSENPGYWYTDNNALSTLQKHEMHGATPTNISRQGSMAK